MHDTDSYTSIHHIYRRMAYHGLLQREIELHRVIHPTNISLTKKFHLHAPPFFYAISHPKLIAKPYKINSKHATRYIYTNKNSLSRFCLDDQQINLFTNTSFFEYTHSFDGVSIGHDVNPFFLWDVAIHFRQT